MPKSSPAKLAFQKKYNAQPEELAKRIKNNAARQAALKAGTAHKGDNTQVDHIVPLDAGGTNAKSNLRVVSRKQNEAWRKKHPKLYGNEK
jgi:5-methylcytosine-specific restriction endonuclease McrA